VLAAGCWVLGAGCWVLEILPVLASATNPISPIGLQCPSNGNTGFAADRITLQWARCERGFGDRVSVEGCN
jgi:hypothetical protein